MLIKENKRTAYDLIVLGGGSAGFAAAIQAHEMGAEVALVNTGTLGGTCVNVGCVPSKTLIRAAEAHYRPTAHGFAGIKVTSRAADFKAIMRQKDELVDSLRRAKYIDVLEAYAHIHLIEGAARLRSAQAVEVDGVALEAPRIIVATGSRPWFPAIPGLSDIDPLTSTSAFELDHLPESMIVLGGRYISLECAQMFARLGTQVTILQRSAHLLPTEDEDLTDALAAYLRAESISVETSVQIERIRQDNRHSVVEALIDGEARWLNAEQVLCATGRRPCTDALGLADIGIELATMFHPYLTQAEGIKLCAQTFGKDVRKLSCCSA